ncbi:MAG: MFS transporter [Desulfobacterales bacterium]|jgi:MFS family permease|nr:MFS transporter [Desulfobacterales bacterium]
MSPSPIDTTNMPLSPDANYIKKLIIFSMIGFLCYIAVNMRLPLVPVHAASMGISTAQIGFINAVYYLIACVMSLPLAFFSDSFGKKAMACTGLIVLSISAFSLCIAHNVIQFAAIYAGLGLGLAAYLPTMMALVADISPLSHLGRSYGWFTTAQNVGAGLGPAIGALLVRRIGFSCTFMVMGIAIFFSCLWSFLSIPNSPPPLSRVSSSGLSGLSELYRNRRLMIGFLATVINCFGLGMFTTFFPLFAQNRHLQIEQIGWVFLAQGVINAVSRIPLGRISDSVSDRISLVAWGSFIIALSMAGFGLSTQFVPFLLSALVLGVGVACAFTAIGALIAESAPTGHRSLAMGCYNTCIFLSLMISSACMGGVVEWIGFDIGFLLTSAGMLLTIFFIRSPAIGKP